MKIHHSLSVNCQSFLSKTNSLVSPLKTAVFDFKNLSAKDTAELSPKIKKRLKLLDQIKANEENLWENIDIHYGYMIGFAIYIKKRLEHFVECVDTLISGDSYEYEKAFAR